MHCRRRHIRIHRQITIEEPILLGTEPSHMFPVLQLSYSLLHVAIWPRYRYDVIRALCWWISGIFWKKIHISFASIAKFANVHALPTSLFNIIRPPSFFSAHILKYCISTAISHVLVLLDGMKKLNKTLSCLVVPSHTCLKIMEI